MAYNCVLVDLLHAGCHYYMLKSVRSLLEVAFDLMVGCIKSTECVSEYSVFFNVAVNDTMLDEEILSLRFFLTMLHRCTPAGGLVLLSNIIKHFISNEWPFLLPLTRVGVIKQTIILIINLSTVNLELQVVISKPTVNKVTFITFNSYVH